MFLHPDFKEVRALQHDGSGSPRLLIVEDDRRTQDALRRLFAYRGWDVRSATTTAEGLSMLDPPPSCVVVDLSLPDQTGEAILREVRSENRPIRVVVCTGCNDPARLAEIERLRPDAILVKPVDPDELLRVCESGSGADGSDRPTR